MVATPAIVFGDVPDMTPEEHRQCGDAAAALARVGEPRC